MLQLLQIFQMMTSFQDLTSDISFCNLNDEKMTLFALANKEFLILQSRLNVPIQVTNISSVDCFRILETLLVYIKQNLSYLTHVLDVLDSHCFLQKLGIPSLHPKQQNDAFWVSSYQLTLAMMVTSFLNFCFSKKYSLHSLLFHKLAWIQCCNKDVFYLLSLSRLLWTWSTTEHLLLLQNWIEINDPDPISSMTLLNHAITKQQVEQVELLLNFGARHDVETSVYNNSVSVAWRWSELPSSFVKRLYHLFFPHVDEYKDTLEFMSLLELIDIPNLKIHSGIVKKLYKIKNLNRRDRCNHSLLFYCSSVSLLRLFMFHGLIFDDQEIARCCHRLPIDVLVYLIFCGFSAQCMLEKLNLFFTNNHRGLSFSSILLESQQKYRKELVSQLNIIVPQICQDVLKMVACYL